MVQPEVPALRHQGAQPGGVEVVQPAADVAAVGEQPGQGVGLGGEQPVLHRERSEGAGGLPGGRGGVGHGQPGREGRRLVEPPGEQRARQHGQHVPPAGRKAEGGNVAGVPAEGCDVLFHPVKGAGGVQQREVAGGVGPGAEGGQAVEAQQAQPVPHRDDDAAGLLGQAGAVHLQGGAGAVAAAVEVDRHRQPRRVCGGVDVQPQAVLAAGRRAAAGLQRHGGGGGAVKGGLPGGGRLRALPAQPPRRGRGIGHPVPDVYPAAEAAARYHPIGGGAGGAGGRLHRRRAGGVRIQRAAQPGGGKGPARLEKTAP